MQTNKNEKQRRPANTNHDSTSIFFYRYKCVLKIIEFVVKRILEHYDNFLTYTSNCTRNLSIYQRFVWKSENTLGNDFLGRSKIVKSTVVNGVRSYFVPVQVKRKTETSLSFSDLSASSSGTQ